jgi:DNA repair exonuclease SbcCD ATPase subunit
MAIEKLMAAEIKSAITSELLASATDKQKDKYFELLRQLDDTGAIDKTARAFIRLRDEMTIEYEAAKMEEDARRLKETLQREFQDLQTLINFDLMPSFEDFTDSLEDVAKQEQDIRDRMADVNEQVVKYRKEITKIRAGDEGLFSDDEQARIDGINSKIGEYLEKIAEIEDKPGIITEEQRKRIELAQEDINRYRREIEAIADEKDPFSDKQADRIGTYNERIADASERLADLQEDLAGIPEKVDEIREAWSRQTKEMIFNLAAQRLATDGLTTEELKALATLAGPKGFGLIDESGEALINIIGTMADQLDLTGDQSYIFVDVLTEVQEALGNTESSVEELDEALNMLEDRELEISVKYSVGDFPGLSFADIASKEDIARLFEGIDLRQGGGPLTGFDIVGERGPEMIVGGMVYSADKTQRFLRSLSDIINVPAELFSRRQGTATQSPTNNSQTTTTYGDQNYNLTIHTSAPYEPMAANFRMMRAFSRRN